MQPSQLPNVRQKDRQPSRKFSAFIKRLVVELDRDPSLYPEGNIIEVGALPIPFIRHDINLTIVAETWRTTAAAGWF